MWISCTPNSEICSFSSWWLMPWCLSPFSWCHLHKKQQSYQLLLHYAFERADAISVVEKSLFRCLHFFEGRRAYVWRWVWLNTLANLKNLPLSTSSWRDSSLFLILWTQELAWYRSSRLSIVVDVNLRKTHFIRQTLSNHTKVVHSIHSSVRRESFFLISASISKWYEAFYNR